MFSFFLFFNVVFFLIVLLWGWFILCGRKMFVTFLVYIFVGVSLVKERFLLLILLFFFGLIGYCV